MPRISTYKNIVITNAGGNIDLDVTEPYHYYTVDGTGITLANPLSITTSGTGQKGMTFEIRYNGAGLISAGANTVTIFGVVLTYTQALKKGIFTSVYNGSAWVTDFELSAEQTNTVNTANIENLAVTTAKINNLGVTTVKIAAKAVTATEIDDNTITASQIAAGTITTTEISPGTICIDAVCDALLNFTIVVPISFATAYLGSKSAIDLDNGVEIYGIAASVTTTIAGTDDASIAIALNNNPVGQTPLVIPMSTPQNAGVSMSITSLNTTDNFTTITLIPSKTTQGGTCLVSLYCKKRV